MEFPPAGADSTRAVCTPGHPVHRGCRMPGRLPTLPGLAPADDELRPWSLVPAPLAAADEEDEELDDDEDDDDADDDLDDDFADDDDRDGLHDDEFDDDEVDEDDDEDEEEDDAD